MYKHKICVNLTLYYYSDDMFFGRFFCNRVRNRLRLDESKQRIHITD